MKEVKQILKNNKSKNNYRMMMNMITMKIKFKNLKILKKYIEIL